MIEEAHLGRNLVLHEMDDLPFAGDDLRSLKLTLPSLLCSMSKTKMKKTMNEVNERSEVFCAEESHVGESAIGEKTNLPFSSWFILIFSLSLTF